MSDRIEKSIDLNAPVERVWSALTDYKQFGEWFRVAVEKPFAVGEESTGHITHPGYEHVVWRAAVEAMDAPSRFAFRWHPYAIDPDVDYSAEPRTLVEFLLTAKGAGTHLKIVESGFDAIPEARRAEAFRMNERGWDQQVKNIAAHVGG